MRKYYLTIETDNDSHSVNVFTSKRAALKAASILRRYGNFYLEASAKEYLRDILEDKLCVMVNDGNGNPIYARDVTKSLAESLKRIAKKSKR